MQKNKKACLQQPSQAIAGFVFIVSFFSYFRFLLVEKTQPPSRDRLWRRNVSGNAQKQTQKICRNFQFTQNLINFTGAQKL
jgi:hypothetical protein